MGRVPRPFRRKVALGDCGRSYDTPCIHEHSCLRCPLLRPDPAQRPRLAEICGNLTARIAEAGARHKLAQMDQITARRHGSTQLGMPAFPDVAGRAVTTPATHPASQETLMHAWGQRPEPGIP